MKNVDVDVDESLYTHETLTLTKCNAIHAC